MILELKRSQYKLKRDDGGHSVLWETTWGALVNLPGLLTADAEELFVEVPGHAEDIARNAEDLLVVTPLGYLAIKFCTFLSEAKHHR